MPLTSFLSNWRSLTLPLIFTLLFPLLYVTALVSASWLSLDPILPIILVWFASLLLPYVYFPWATARKQFFSRHNSLKSIAVVLPTFEVYRLSIFYLAREAGISTSALIQQHCGKPVYSIGLLVECAFSAMVAVTVVNVIFWLVPALLLEFISTRLPSYSTLNTRTNNE
jgi:hypothetical protein